MSESARDGLSAQPHGVQLHKTRREAPTTAPGTTAGLRIGTAERDQAAAALAEHFSAGRLDSVEFDERTRAVYAARTFEDLDPMFSDLPAPRPTRPRIEGPQAAAWAEGRAARDSYPGGLYRRAAGQRGNPLRIGLLLLFALACLAWVALTRIPPFFIFPLFWLVVMRRPGPRRHRYR